MSIQRASKSIAKKAGSLDGQLFVVKHLLILREQVRSPNLSLHVLCSSMPQCPLFAA